MIRPLLDRVLLEKPVTKEEITAGGIVLPTMRNEKPFQTTVVAVGAGRPDPNGNLIPMVVKPGDVVILPNQGLVSVKFGENEYYLIKEENLLGIVEPDPVVESN